MGDAAHASDPAAAVCPLYGLWEDGDGGRFLIPAPSGDRDAPFAGWAVRFASGGAEQQLLLRAVSWLTPCCPPRRTLLAPAGGPAERKQFDFPASFSPEAVRELRVGAAGSAVEWTFAYDPDGAMGGALPPNVAVLRRLQQQ
eukprot:TRINITY_DN32062_c0_g1_i1.p2 TRINITY_DN32062_c0_g1~~TRINITY_DN32062_c0_g1_i1.p2  ORF type:complete len:167 (+),score=64.69 TRINITY_DN32062_c0_g1_i1:78-503(+)